MNKSESRYFVTAAKMDRAFLELLEKKDLPYITVKEICEKAGVNRSTFYLHYETIGDLLAESAEHINEDFLNCVRIDSGDFASKLHNCPIEELYLITPEYLIPYLTYISENRRLFKTALENAAVLRLDESYAKMMRHIIMPIFERYGVPERDRGYIMSFYVHGIMALIGEWLKGDCCDSIEYISGMIQGLVKKYTGSGEKN